MAFQTTPWAKETVRKTRHFESVVTDVTTSGINSGEFREDRSASLVAKTLFGMVNWTHQRFRPGYASTLESRPWKRFRRSS